MIGFDYLDRAGPVTLNQSNFSRANKNRSYRLWRYCFHQLWKQAKAHCQPNQLAGLGQILAVDGTFFACLDRMLWAVYRTSSHKLKGHFFFDLDGLPEKLVLTAGIGSEREVLRQHIRPGLTYIFDRGYNDYDLFRYFTTLGSYFVTRILKNAVFAVVETYTLTAEQQASGVISDQLICLDKDKVLTRLRLVTYLDRASGKEYRYLTNRTDVDALTIALLYKWRWQIERFFWWIKRHLQFKHLYSQCENGVLIQLYAGLIAFLLIKLYSAKNAKTEFRRMHIDLVRFLERHLFDLVSLEDILSYLRLLGFTGSIWLV